MRNRTFLKWELRDKMIVSEGDSGWREVHTDPWMSCDDHTNAPPARSFLFLARLEISESDFVLFADEKNGFIVGEVIQLQRVDMLLCQIPEVAARYRLQ